MYIPQLVGKAHQLGYKKILSQLRIMCTYLCVCVCVCVSVCVCVCVCVYLQL